MSTAMVTGQISDAGGTRLNPALGFPVQPFFPFVPGPFPPQQIGVAPPAHGAIPASAFMPPPQQHFHLSSLEQQAASRKSFPSKGFSGRISNQQHVARKLPSRSIQGRQGQGGVSIADLGARLGGRKSSKQMRKARRKQRQMETKVHRMDVKEFHPPRLQDLREKHRVRTRKFFASSKGRGGMPDAPRNTTSFLMGTSKPAAQALYSSPTTPGLFQQPVASPAPLVGQSGDDMSELHVNPYGTMNGVIRLRTPGGARSDGTCGAVDKDGEASGESEATTSSESGADGDVDGAAGQPDQQVDQDLLQPKLLYAIDNVGQGGQTGDLFLRARIEEQESQIALLEEENLDLKEKLYLAQMELKDLRRGQEEGSGDAEVDGHSDDEASCAADCAGEESFATPLAEDSIATPLQVLDS